MLVYHRTTAAAAEAIMQDGFRDSTGRFMTSSEHTGVWVSNVPLDENEGAHGDTVLEVSVDESHIAEYEWIQDIGYREWLVPAVVLNSQTTVRRLSESEVDEIVDRFSDR